MPLVLTLVGMQLSGPTTQPAALAPHGGNSVEQRLEHPAVMDVGAAQGHRQGNVRLGVAQERQARLRASVVMVARQNAPQVSAPAA